MAGVTLGPHRSVRPQQRAGPELLQAPRGSRSRTPNASSPEGWPCPQLEGGGTSGPAGFGVGPTNRPLCAAAGAGQGALPARSERRPRRPAPGPRTRSAPRSPSAAPRLPPSSFPLPSDRATEVGSAVWGPGKAGQRARGAGASGALRGAPGPPGRPGTSLPAAAAGPRLRLGSRRVGRVVGAPKGVVGGGRAGCRDPGAPRPCRGVAASRPSSFSLHPPSAEPRPHKRPRGREGKKEKRKSRKKSGHGAPRARPAAPRCAPRPGRAPLLRASRSPARWLLAARGAPASRLQTRPSPLGRPPGLPETRPGFAFVLSFLFSQDP